MKKDWEKNLPPASLNVHEQNLQEFFTLMHKRQEIWYERSEGLPYPWSNDEILNKYRFCNVYRELDRTTQYLIQNVYLKETDLNQVVFSILAHRIYNKPETFKRLGYPKLYEYDEHKWLQRLAILEQTGFHVLNQEAYKINTYAWGGTPRWCAYTMNILTRFANIGWCEDFVKLLQTGTALEVVKELRNFCGTFLAHEYYQDFCDLNTYWNPGTTKFDKNSWTAAGPGAKGGLRLIFPSLLENRAEEGLRWLQALAPDYLNGMNFRYLHWNHDERSYFVCSEGEINLHILEFWTCEYLKYKKMQWGTGKQRQKFVYKKTISHV